jgi:carboxyl-terminal processing protease
MNKHLTSLLALVVLCLFSACSKDDLLDAPVGSIDNNKYVNNWMTGVLSQNYYWNDKLKSGVDRTMSPDAYFDSIMYWYNPVTAPDGDRFSWIQQDYVELLNSLQGIESNEIGFDMTLYKIDSDQDLIGQVNYVKKNTPAETAGIQRGMIFNKINGTQLTLSNYSTLLQFTESQYVFNIVEPVFNPTEDAIEYLDVKQMSVQSLSSYTENPVYLDTVFTQFSGHKIGYLVYNFFSPDAGNSTSSYDVQLNAAFGRFKQQGITDLILDLRYNSGGSVLSAIHLASSIVPNLTTSKLLTKFEYNSNYSSEDLYFSNVITNSKGSVVQSINDVGNQLGGRLYVLTGHYTASASEFVINGLKPYMNVYLVGDTTYGKNVASVTFYDKNNTSKNKWGLQPIVAKFFNSLGQSDFTMGFFPDVCVNDGGSGMLELADVNERLLNQALGLIVGNQLDNVSSKSSERSGINRWKELSTHQVRGLQLIKSAFY